MTKTKQNFSFCMIIPQRFQFASRTVRLLCFLQSVENDPLGVAGTLARAREIVNDMTVVLRKFWAALGRRRTITEMNDGVGKMGPPLTLPLTLYRGEGSDSRIDSSVRVTLSGHHTHPIYPPPPPPPSPLDVYLWGYLKYRVYKNNPQTIGDLKRAFTVSIRAIPIEEGVRITDNFVLRLQACLQRQAGHLEYSLERT